MKTAVRKVLGGKLIRVDVEYSDGIEDIKITGDFFLHPEELISGIEKGVIGCKIEGVLDRINKILLENNGQLIGITPEDIMLTIKEAIK